MDMSLFLAGTGGSVPSARRGLPAILLRRGGERLLFDCGEGTQRQLLRSVGLADVECVFITHFHADHWLGLPGMLKSFALRDREQPLTVYGPVGLKRLMEETRFIYGRRLPYALTIMELQPAQALERDGYRVAAVPVNHGGGAAVGYVIVEDGRPGELDPALAERLGVTPGPDFGRLVRGETVNGVAPEQVVGPPREGRKVVISGDTAPCEALAIAAHEADVLVHEATFTEEEANRARQTGHSTARQAAQLARDAQARMLILTHLSTRYAGREVREEARAIYPGAELARDFDTVEIPFPERGPAQLIRWSSRSAGADAGGEAAAGNAGGGEGNAGGGEATAGNAGGGEATAGNAGGGEAAAVGRDARGGEPAASDAGDEWADDANAVASSIMQ